MKIALTLEDGPKGQLSVMQFAEGGEPDTVTPASLVVAALHWLLRKEQQDLLQWIIPQSLSSPAEAPRSASAPGVFEEAEILINNDADNDGA